MKSLATLKASSFTIPYTIAAISALTISVVGLPPRFAIDVLIWEDPFILLAVIWFSFNELRYHTSSKLSFRTIY